MGVLDDFSQQRFPEPFRIGPAPWPEELRGAVEKLSRPVAPGGEEAGMVELLKKLATELFRARKKMLKPGTNDPLEEMRRPYRHVEAMWEVLREAEVEVQDHDGHRFEAGLELTVIAYQPTPGLGRETILETIRPSIYHKGRLLQRGEVVVGTPEPKAGADPGGQGTQVTSG